MTQPPRHPLTPSEILTLPHSALCDASTLRWIGGRQIQPLCTCGAGVLRLMAGER